MPTLDTRKEALDAQARFGLAMVIGLRMVTRRAALAANSLGFALEPGEVAIGQKVAQFAGRDSVAVYDGSTLADLSELYSASVAYYNPELDKILLVAVDGAVALTAGGAVKPSDDDIEAALPNAEYDYTVIGMAKFARSGTAITATYDHVERSYGVLASEKETSDIEHAGEANQKYRPWGTLHHTLTAAEIANGDLLTDLPLPLITGRIVRWRAVCESVISTAAKTTTPHLEIGAVAVTGSDAVAYASTKALGEVTALGAPTAANTFKSGDVVSIVAALTTAFIEGRVRFEIDIEQAEAA